MECGLQESERIIGLEFTWLRLLSKFHGATVILSPSLAKSPFVACLGPSEQLPRGAGAGGDQAIANIYNLDWDNLRPTQTIEFIQERQN